MTNIFFRFEKLYFWTIFCPFSQFRGQKQFSKKKYGSVMHTTSKGFLVQCHNSEKDNDPIPRKHSDR